MILEKIRSTFSRLSDHKKALLFFVILVTVVFFGVVINRETFFSNVGGLPLKNGSYYYDGPKPFWDLDATTYMHMEVPQTIYWAKELRSGHFAFWNPYQGDGQPLSGSITSAAYNPIKLVLFAIFPGMKTFDFYLLLRFVIAGFGAYLFLKKIGLSLKGSLIGGVTYMFSAYFVIWITHGGFAADMMTPYLLFGIEYIISSHKIKSIFLLGLAWGVMVLSQNPEAVILISLFSLAYFIYRCCKTKENKGRKILLFTLALCIAFIISLPMLWDTTLFFSQGSANNGHDFEWISTYQASHSNFLVQVERFFHLPVPPALFLEPSLVGTSTMREDSLIVTYLGTFILLLSIAAISFKKKNSPSLPLVFFGGTILFFILMWLGVPPISWLERLPVFKSLNFFRYISLFHFALAILAAIGFENIRNQNINFKKYKIILLSLLAPFTCLMVFSPSFRHSYQLTFNQIDLNKINHYLNKFPPLLQGFINWFIHSPYSVATLVFSVTAFFFLLFFLLWKKKMFNLIFIFLIIEMVIYIPKLRDTSNFQNPYQEPPFVVYLKSLPDFESYRILAVYRTLMTQVASGYGIKNVETIEGVVLKNYVASLQPLFKGGFLTNVYEMYNFGKAEFLDNKDYLPFFNTASIKYIISEEALPKGAPYKLIYSNEVKIYENNEALPIARIETKQGKIFLDAKIILREPNRLIVQTNSKENGLLVLSETYYPGWRAFVDGKEENITQVHESFRGVPISGGSHNVEFKYWPLFTKDTLRAILHISPPSAASQSLL